MGNRKMSESNYATPMLIVLVFAFLIRILLVHVHPFYLDEGLYTETISEQLDHPGMVMTYLGFPVAWKPPLFFWLYALPVAGLKMLSTDVELVFRLPNILLGVLNVWLIFSLFRRIENEKIGFYAALLYAFCPLTIYTDLRVLVDTLNATFIFASLYFYFGKSSGKNTFAGALFAFLAAMTKSVVALLIPIIAIIEYWRRGQISRPLLLSLLAAPLGIALHYLILFQFAPQLAGSELAFDFIGRFDTGDSSFEKIGFSYGGAFGFLNFLLVFAAIGLWKFWRKSPQLDAWLLLIAIPLAGSGGLVWYFYPFVPILAYFSVKGLSYDYETKGEKYDHFFKAVLAFLVAINLVTLATWYYYYKDKMLEGERALGTSLAGKENVFFAGEYSHMITTITYKILNERAAGGKYLDYGWINIAPGGRGRFDEEFAFAKDFVLNYSTKKYQVNENNFGVLFWTRDIFRKPTNISTFDYAVFILNEDPGNASKTIEGYNLITDNGNTLVYKRIS